jgi:hypothetical protein
VRVQPAVLVDGYTGVVISNVVHDLAGDSTAGPDLINITGS